MFSVFGRGRGSFLRQLAMWALNSGVSVSVGKAIAAEKLLTSIRISRSYKSAFTQAWDLLMHI